MFKRLLLLPIVLLLPACAYFIDKHIQDIEFTTTGAEDAICNVYIDNVRYKVHPPQTINISNTEEDMLIDCLAPGNRRMELTVPAHVNAKTIIGLPGLPWDYASKAMFKYPDTIDIDFTGIESRAQPLPAQNNPDIPQPEEYDLEEFSPGQPRLNADKNKQQLEIVPRKLPPYVQEGAGAPDMDTMGPPSPDDKSALMTVIQDLRNKVDPTVVPPPAAEGAEPTSLTEDAPVNDGSSLPGDGDDPLGIKPKKQSYPVE